MYLHRHNENMNKQTIMNMGNKVLIAGICFTSTSLVAISGKVKPAWWVTVLTILGGLITLIASLIGLVWLFESVSPLQPDLSPAGIGTMLVMFTMLAIPIAVVIYTRHIGNTRSICIPRKLIARVKRNGNTVVLLVNRNSDKRQSRDTVIITLDGEEEAVLFEHNIVTGDEQQPQFYRILPTPKHVRLPKLLESPSGIELHNEAAPSQESQSDNSSAICQPVPTIIAMRTTTEGVILMNMRNTTGWVMVGLVISFLLIASVLELIVTFYHQSPSIHLIILILAIWGFLSLWRYLNRPVIWRHNEMAQVQRSGRQIALDVMTSQTPYGAGHYVLVTHTVNEAECLTRALTMPGSNISLHISMLITEHPRQQERS